MMPAGVEVGPFADDKVEWLRMERAERMRKAGSALTTILPHRSRVFPLFEITTGLAGAAVALTLELPVWAAFVGAVAVFGIGAALDLFLHPRRLQRTV